MPSPVAMCCAAGICCPPGSAEQQAAMDEVRNDFAAADIDPKRVFHKLSALFAVEGTHGLDAPGHET